ncbi:MAG: sulfotransferase domain-containing protein [Rhabdochlamydiaceae bacterium]|nr:sulfotransferase domain-containing protein [Rhabdochlamydiaceae bacterium]
MQKFNRFFLILAPIFLFFPAILSFANESVSTAYILTMPKGGTNLLVKALRLLTHQEYSLGGTQKINHLNVTFDHLWPQYQSTINEPSSLKIIFFRDPRDMIISQMFWIEQVNNWASGLLPQKMVDDFQRLSTDEKIHYLINLPDINCGANYFAHLIAANLTNPSVVAFRFEDMVGPLGGGSAAKQDESICILADLLGYTLTPSSLNALCTQLFGNTPTFREGKIGSWKNYFTEEHKSAFKEKMGKELILLGYEEDNAW